MLTISVLKVRPCEGLNTEKSCVKEQKANLLFAISRTRFYVCAQTSTNSQTPLQLAWQFGKLQPSPLARDNQ